MSRSFIVFYCFLLLLPMTPMVYMLIPKIISRSGKQKYQNENKNRIAKHFLSYFKHIPFPEKWKEVMIRKMDESGFGDHVTWIYWAGMILLLPIFLFLLLAIRDYAIGTNLACCILCFILPNIFLNSKIEKRKRAFIINAYKLYYFLHSQISSGIKVTDAIKGLYEIADHPLIQRTFIQFVANYELTLNIEESLQILRKSFSGYDCEMLCVSIQQCVNTGMAGKTLLKMEQMMFAKYFFYLQKDTEKFKTKLFVSGIFAITPLIMIFLFPILFDAVKAFEQIMQTS